MESNNTSKRNLFLHIGNNKTGSTSIQGFFAKNREQLKSVGILYPETGNFLDTHYKISGALGIGVKPQMDVENYTQESLLASLNSEIASCESINTLVISSEYFMLTKDASPVREFFRDFNVKIVIYLRRHDEWYESLYNQVIKTTDKRFWKKGLKNYIEYIKSERPFPVDYEFLINVWETAFGTENIIIRPFESAQFYKEDLGLDILNSIGINTGNLPPLETVRMNESLDTRAINIIDDVKRSSLTDSQKREMLNKLNIFYFSKMNYKKFYNLTKRDRQSFIDENKEAYDRIAKKWLEKDAFFLDNVAKEGHVIGQNTGNHYVRLVFRLLETITHLKGKLAELKSV